MRNNGVHSYVGSCLYMIDERTTLDYILIHMREEKGNYLVRFFFTDLISKKDLYSIENMIEF